MTKIKLIIISLGFLVGTLPNHIVSAISCPDLRIVFARGSGGGAYDSADYLEFKNTIEEKIHSLGLTYDFIDLDYPAVSVGLDHLDNMLGAAISSGEAYNFGDSVRTGVDNLVSLVNGACTNTQYILGGYSQGAMVIIKALPRLDASRVIYAATFGDPKLFLPEGEGIIPKACLGENLSDYRAYVPECHVYEGLLGGMRNYQPSDFIGKLGTWCNKHDIMCSRFFNLGEHLRYIDDGLYEDASRKIYNKIIDHYKLSRTYLAPHDTAILIDSTGSMAGIINRYKAEALRLANETFSSNGRVALYDYRDLDDPYTPHEYCNFETCTPENIKGLINSITVDGGGDTLESLLSASYTLMRSLRWHYGAVKSVVVLTDAGYHLPDLDGIGFEDVVTLSRSIDPVNFYVITNDANLETYQSLATATDGQVVSINDNLSLLTDHIIARYDSLPMLEDLPMPTSATSTVTPTLTIANSELAGEIFHLEFTTNAERIIVALNDAILGITTEHSLNFTNLDLATVNTIRLIPVIGETLGAPINVDIPLLLAAPNTGITL